MRFKFIFVVSILVVVSISCIRTAKEKDNIKATPEVITTHVKDKPIVKPKTKPKVKPKIIPTTVTKTVSQTATFGGGCFWCMQPAYDNKDGVISTTVGYMGGKVKNPTYRQICGGKTGHAEVIQIIYDPAKISYKTLLEIFWQNTDPTTLNQQFADRGTQYRTAIFYHNEKQKSTAEKSKQKEALSTIYQGRPIVTEITKASKYYKEQDPYHQKYYLNYEKKYLNYKYFSGRTGYIKAKKEIKEKIKEK